MTIRLDLTTAPAEIIADIYLIMFDPDGKFYSAMVWSKGLQPLVQGFKLPADLHIQSSPLVNITLPSTTPPVEKSGKYTFYLAAMKPGTVDFISNIASCGFTFQ